MFIELGHLEEHLGPYAKDFDASKIPDDEIEEINSTRSLRPMLDFHKKYGCEICEDGIFNLNDNGFSNTTDETIEAHKFLIYRHPYMKKVGKKQACPECFENEKAKKAVKSTSELMTKTDAMKEFKLSKEKIETLEVKEQKTGQWGLISLYSRSECQELGRKVQAEKEQAMEEEKSLITKTDARKEFKLSKEEIETLSPKKQKTGGWTGSTLYSRAECEELSRKIQEEKEKEKEDEKSLITKTDARKEFKLSKEEIETLSPKKEKSAQWGPTSLYSRTECEELGKKVELEKERLKEEKERRKEEEKERRKEEEKEKKEEGKKRKREEKETSPAKSTAKSPKKKTDNSRVEPYSKSPAKRRGRPRKVVEEESEGDSES